MRKSSIALTLIQEESSKQRIVLKIELEFPGQQPYEYEGEDSILPCTWFSLY